MNIILFFFDDVFFEWPSRNKFESLVDTNSDLTLIGVTFPLSLLTIFSNPYRLRLLFRRKKKVRKGIYSFTPLSLLPVDLVNRNRFLIILHKWIFKIQINSFLDEIGAKENRVTWIHYLKAFPIFYGIVKNSKLSIYNCIDENTMEQGIVFKERKEMEEELMRKVDIVIAVSRDTYVARMEKNKNCCLISNGVDFSFFRKANSLETQVDEELRLIPKPIVGYLGNIRSWLDFDLLAFLSDNFPNVSFVFVGLIEPDVRRGVSILKRRKNVYFLKRRDRALLPGVLKAFDVCLIPFKLNQFNLATNPFKFWEYLATGKPILSLRLPDLEPYENILYLYTSKEEALEKLRNALSEKDFHMQKCRMDIAQANDLSLKSKQYYEILLRHLNK